MGFFNWLSGRKHNSVMVGWITYRPEDESPNVFFNIHPDLQADEYLHEKWRDIAEHLRKHYSDWQG